MQCELVIFPGGHRGTWGTTALIREFRPSNFGGQLGDNRGRTFAPAFGLGSLSPFSGSTGDNLGDAGISMAIAYPTCPPRPPKFCVDCVSSEKSSFIPQPPTACRRERKPVLARFPAVGASVLAFRRCPAQASRARAETVLQTWNQIRHTLPA